MRASEVSCEVVSGLMVRWNHGAMDDAERSAYEQHLLFCPPCLVQNDKTRAALAALPPAAAATVPPEDLVRRLKLLITGDDR